MPEGNDVVANEAVDTSGALPPMSAPEVVKPTLAEEIESRTAELNQAMADAGIAHKRVPAGMKALKRAEADTGRATPGEPEGLAKAEAIKPPSPKTAEEIAQEKQARLSVGFHKLARQTKESEDRLARRTRATEEREAAIKSAESALQAQREAWQKENAAKLEELALLDTDELKFLDGLAKRRGTTRQAIYDRMTRGMLEGGQTHASDVAADLQKEIAALKAEHAADKEARDKATAAERDAEQRRDAERQAAHVAEQERQQFVKWIHEGAHADKAAKDVYPLLADEPPAEVARFAWELGADYARRTGKPATFELVAAHMEQHLRYQRYLEAQAKPAPETAKPKGAAVPPSVATEPSKSAQPEPKAVASAKPKPVNPNTLTHSVASLRTGIRQGPRNENQRLQDAVDMWEAHKR